MVIDLKDYLEETYKLLYDSGPYRKHENDPTKQHQKQLAGTLRQFDDETRKQILDGIPNEARIGYFYILPKIHKSGNPGLPIVP